MKNKGIFKASFREIADLSTYLVKNVLFNSGDRVVSLKLTSDSGEESFFIHNDLELYEVLIKHPFDTLTASCDWSVLVVEYFVVAVPVPKCQDPVVYGDYNYDVFMSV